MQSLYRLTFGCTISSSTIHGVNIILEGILISLLFIVELLTQYRRCPQADPRDAPNKRASYATPSA